MKRVTGKDRWSRIRKDYFRSRDRIQSLKLIGWVTAMVLAVGWWASGVDWKGGLKSSTDGNSLLANHGELNRVHAAWADKCDACHIPFQPIASRSSDKLCMSCHAGPTHHATVIDTEVKSCSQCHRDHQGADFSLVKLKDGDCTSCHASLVDHVNPALKSNEASRYKNVVKFDAAPENHPPFRPEAALFENDKPPVDKSRLKFNHARHMMPGIVEKADDVTYKIENIPLVEERERYRKTTDPKEPVQLKCSSCHVLDSTEQKSPANPSFASSTALPARSSGRYYLPATFDSSCRACHVLTVVDGANPIELPHGVQTDRIKEFLKATFSARAFSNDPKALADFVPKVRIPGKSPVDSSVITKRDESVKNALKSLFPASIPAARSETTQQIVHNQQNCLECHHYGAPGTDGFPTQVEPTRVPEIWFTRAAFDHSAHRGVSCRECHSKAYAYEADEKTAVIGASIVATDYLNPGIDNCVQCHAPSKSSGSWLGLGSPSPSNGGVSFDCTECHRYHNGDNRLQGYGASAEDSTTIRSIRQYLDGQGGDPVRFPSTELRKP